MAIAQRGTGQSKVNGAGASTVVVNKPTGVVTNDVMYAAVYADSATHATLAGWTEVAFKQDGASANYVTVLRRVSNGSEGTTFTFTGASNIWNGAVCAFSGADTTTPEDATTTTSSGAGASVIAPTITTVTDNAWWLAIFETDGTASTLSLPTGFTNDVALFGGVGSGDFMRIDHKVKTPAGATGTATSTMDTTDGWITVSIAIRPAAGAATNPFTVPLQPNPNIRPTRDQSFQDPSEFWMLKDKFFGAVGMGPDYDYPNPRGSVPNITLRTFTNSYTLGLIGKDKFFGAPGIGPDYDWPNPRGATPASDLRTHLWNPFRTLLNVVVAIPFNLLNWPNPWVKPNPVDTRTIADASEFWMLQDTFFGVAGQPPANLDWPVPKGKPYPLSTFLASLSQLFGLDRFFGAAGQPPANVDWPNPPRNALPNIELRTHSQSLKQNILGQDTFFGLAGQPPANLDWPVPQAPRQAITARTWVQNLLQNTLAPAAVAAGANLILVGGRLAIKVKGIIYEFLD